MQFLAQHREIVVVVRMQEPRAMVGAAQCNAIAFRQTEVRLSVAPVPIAGRLGFAFRSARKVE